MESRQRNPMEVGMVYKVLGMGPWHKENRIIEGDIVVCLEHSGDCHYSWALMIEEEGNDMTRYFSVDKVYQSYVISGERLLPKPLSQKEIISLLISQSITSRAGLLIPRPKKETTTCPNCGREMKK